MSCYWSTEFIYTLLGGFIFTFPLSMRTLMVSHFNLYSCLEEALVGKYTLADTFFLLCVKLSAWLLNATFLTKAEKWARMPWKTRRKGKNKERKRLLKLPVMLDFVLVCKLLRSVTANEPKFISRHMEGFQPIGAYVTLFP